jgi:hypothetical protein
MAATDLQMRIMQRLAANRSAVNADGVPVEVNAGGLASVILRKATSEPDVMPQPVEFGTTGWSKS